MTATFPNTSRKRHELSVKLDGLIEFGIEELLGRIGKYAGQTYAGAAHAARTGVGALREGLAAQSAMSRKSSSVLKEAFMPGSSAAAPAAQAATSAAAAASSVPSAAAATAAAAPSATSNLTAKLSKARRGARAKMPPSVGTVGTHDVPLEAPHPSSLVWGGQTGEIQSGRAKAGVQGYLGAYNTGSQSAAAQSFAQKAAMAKRGMSGQQVGGGQAGGITDWWNKQSPTRKVAIGAGAGVAAGVAGSALLSSNRREQQYSSKLKQVKIFESAEEPIEFVDPRDRNNLGQFEPEGSGGPSPNNMAIVYKHPGLLGSVAKGGALAVTGGALGHLGGEAGKQLLDQVKKRSKKALRKIK
jgi:hypothetical protein